MCFSLSLVYIFQEGQKLDKEGKLMICPVCQGPVRCTNSNNLGQCEKCRYKFCTNCHSNYHYSTRCSRISSLPSIHHMTRNKRYMMIGTKESKRRLSRTLSDL